MKRVQLRLEGHIFLLLVALTFGSHLGLLLNMAIGECQLQSYMGNGLTLRGLLRTTHDVLMKVTALQEVVNVMVQPYRGR